MIFDVAGPFQLERKRHSRLISKDAIKRLMDDAEGCKEGLSNACGCYVFVLATSRATIPFYVGQACKRSLVREAMNAANVNKFNHVLDEKKKGKPMLFLLPMLTRGGKFRKPSKKGAGRLAAIDFLERYLIHEALNRNRALINTRETKFMKGIRVTGMFNTEQGKSTKASRALHAALWKEAT